ncbi:hypothetical protein IID20_00335 [Patescibacteria group bacterium]|nr:hypothetical protein [Patescibacteria group bacterium]
MKKSLVVLFILFLTAAIAVGQLQMKENFAKAAKEELSKASSQLQELKNEIEIIFSDLVIDSVVTGEEMKKLMDLKTEFDKSTEKLNQPLEFYQQQTKIDLDPKINEVLAIYFNEKRAVVNYTDTSEQEVKKIFVRLAGYDIKIESRPDWINRLSLGGVFGIVFGLYIGFINRDHFKKIFFSVFFISILFFIII